jgi:hypothetical protein
MELVPKLSRVACGLQCTGLWIGGKGFGTSWKLFQCIVKPVEIVKVSGTGICQFQLSNDDRCDEKVAPTVEVPQLKPSSVSVSVSTEVDDSDNEETEPAVVVEETESVVVEPETEPESVVEEAVPEPVVVKKVLKKVVVAPTPVAVDVETESAVEVAVEVPKKKVVIKKKVV